MSNDEPSNAPEPGDRRRAVREKAQHVHAKQKRGRVIRRVSLALGTAVVVAAAAVAVTAAVRSQDAQPDASPAHVVDDGFTVTSVNGVTVGRTAADPDPTTTPTPSPAGTATPSPTPTAGGTVDIRVYVDYYAPGAKQFQVANVQQLTRWVKQDAATLSYYPVAMLSAKSNGTKYSLRAASASACVAAHDPNAFYAFNNALLTKQPAQGDDGFTDAQLADLAIASGADQPHVIRHCIENEEYATWVKSATDRALQGIPGTKGVALTGTPMILVDGVPYVGALDDPKEFAQFVLTASSDSYYNTQTPTPTPTPSASPAS